MEIANLYFNFKRLAMVLPLSFLGCVSFNVGQEESQRASSVKYERPGSSFDDFSNDFVDQSWKNEKTGSTISFLSDCSPSNEYGLEVLKTKPLQGIENLSTKSDQTITYNGRKAFHTTYSGSLDGIETQFEILVFKKNNCSYILSFVALPREFEKDHPHFKKFMLSFEAP